MISVTLRRPWLIADLGGPHRVLSWTLNRPGFATARRIVWRQVRDGDLPRDLDAGAWFAAELAQAGLEDAPAFLTSRDIGRHHMAAARVGAVRAACLATAGLGNAERVGCRQHVAQHGPRQASPIGPPADPLPAAGHGTINLALRIDRPMAEGALIEALSLAVAARTLAMIEHGPRLPGGPASGTGTDCIAIAAPLEAGPAQVHAGMHTEIGEAVGRAVLVASGTAISEWMRQRRAGTLE